MASDEVEVSVLGHDGVPHNVRADGTTLCGMGRASPVEYGDEPVTCMACIDKVCAGHRPAIWALSDLA